MTHHEKPLSPAKQKEIATRAELGPRIPRSTETLRTPQDSPFPHSRPKRWMGKSHPTRDSGTT